MAPTIQSAHLNELDKRSGRNGEKKSDLVCRIKYCNTLPDIPFDPKFITYPFESNRFVQYNPTSLERNYKHDFLTEHDLGVPIDLINGDTYALNDSAALGTLDEKLLEEEQPNQESKRSRHHAKSVSWLRRTEYISQEYTRFQPSSDKTETKVGYNVKRFFKEEDLYMDRDSQIKAIDNTFEDTKRPIEKHHTKPNVTPVESYSLFPDFEMWRYPCAQVIFDSDPASIGRPLPAQLEEMSQAMIRGVMDESGEQFVAYFLPTDDTLKKRKRDVEEGVEYKDEEEYEYTMAREYNWNVKNKASKGYEENYYFVFRNEGVYYNELETRVRLNKRRLKPGTQPNNSRLVVHHRPLNELEFKTQEVRMMQLEPHQEEEEMPQDEDEKEEEPEEDEEEPMETDQVEKESDSSRGKASGKARKIDSDSGSDNDEEAGNNSSDGDEKDKDERKEGSESDLEEKIKQRDSEEEHGVHEDEEEEDRTAQSPRDKDDAESENDEDANAGKTTNEDDDGETRDRSASPAESNSSSSSSSNSSSSSGSGSRSGSGGGGDKSSNSGSDSEADGDGEDEQKKKKDEAEIFGSDSDSD